MYLFYVSGKEIKWSLQLNELSLLVLDKWNERVSQADGE